MKRISFVQLILIFLLLILFSPVICQTGSWQLVRIDGSSVITIYPRKTDQLPLETRERKGLIFQYKDPRTDDQRRIDMDVVFDHIQETYPDDGSMNHLFGITLTARPSGTGRPNTAIRCEESYKTASGGDIAGPFRGHSPVIIYLGTTQKIECGGLAKVSELPKNQDFTVQLRFAVDDYTLFSATEFQPLSGDITYAFTYRWTPTAGAATKISCFESNPGAASIDRNAHSQWASTRDSSELESNLIAKTGTLFLCSKVSPERLAETFANISSTISLAVSNANWSCFAGRGGPGRVTWDGYKAFGANQGPKVMLDTARSEISSVFRCLDLDEQRVLFADVSTQIASGAR